MGEPCPGCETSLTSGALAASSRSTNNRQSPSRPRALRGHCESCYISIATSLESFLEQEDVDIGDLLGEDVLLVGDSGKKFVEDILDGNEPLHAGMPIFILPVLFDGMTVSDRFSDEHPTEFGGVADSTSCRKKASRSNTKSRPFTNGLGCALILPWHRLPACGSYPWHRLPACGPIRGIGFQPVSYHQPVANPLPTDSDSNFLGCRSFIGSQWLQLESDSRCR